MKQFKKIFIDASQVKVITASGKKHIAVIGGGMSSEREVSLSTSESVIKELASQGYQVTFIDMGANLSRVLEEIKPDVVFNALHGTYGEDGCLPGLLNIMHIAYTHSGVLASATALDKIRTKMILNTLNIPTPNFKIVHKSDEYKIDPMPRPYVIKPVNQGSSVGVELVFIEDDFDFADYNFPYGEQIIVEEYIKGRELQVAVLNGKAYGTLELRMLKRRFYDYDSKYTAGFAEHIIPSNISDSISQEILKISELAYNILGCKGLVRAEFIYDQDEQKIYMLELNTHPGMTPLSICQDILAFHGISFSEMIDSLIKSATFE
jgi:D-alanine-D-alanine ligase